jgi:hypothetical protein
VPVTTVHRWVKRARELGFLGPGQKGRREQGEQQTAATDSGIGRPIRRHYDVPREDPIGVPETWPPPVEEPADEAEAQPVIGQKGRRG